MEFPPVLAKKQRRTLAQSHGNWAILRVRFKRFEAAHNIFRRSEDRHTNLFEVPSALYRLKCSYSHRLLPVGASGSGPDLGQTDFCRGLGQRVTGVVANTSESILAR